MLVTLYLVKYASLGGIFFSLSVLFPVLVLYVYCYDDIYNDM